MSSPLSAIKKPIWALGAMSGTSLDGVDVALVLSDGRSIIEFSDHAFRPYSTDEQAILRAALGKWPSQEGVAEAARVVENAHIEAMLPFVGRADLIGFHGQTLAHDPVRAGQPLQKQGRTHQLGDGARLAKALGIRVVWDFRSKDVALGGQGAPLAPFFHFACAKWIKATSPLVFLNLGGVGNMSWVDPRCDHPEQENALLAFDTGPANAPINDLMMARLQKDYDKNGETASVGQVDKAVLNQFLSHEYFAQKPPKSLDRNDFHFLLASVDHLNTADAAATLVACVVGAVVRSIEHYPAAVDRLLLCGGGRHNQTLLNMLERQLPTKVERVDEYGLNGDIFEAQAFAYLATRVAAGYAISAPSSTGVKKPVCGGKISTKDGKTITL